MIALSRAKPRLMVKAAAPSWTSTPPRLALDGDGAAHQPTELAADRQDLSLSEQYHGAPAYWPGRFNVLVPVPSGAAW